MKIFFGAAIQGHSVWGAGASKYSTIIHHLTDLGHKVMMEHTKGKDRAETRALMKSHLGYLPENELDSRIYVRDQLIDMIEGPEVDAFVFEVSTPSLGTGIEISHAYLRPKMGLIAKPILILYEKESWKHKVSTMVQGLRSKKHPYVFYAEYKTEEELKEHLSQFLKQS